ncbi:MAG: PepSY domain-containing protein, partial [Oscillospiraceae bacterium]|nr:PepSY domain-containing protein [Oscillospiraceae bacterium]
MNFKALFSTPKKAVVTAACLLIVLAMTVVCAVYAVNANTPAENSYIGGENAQHFAFDDAGVDPASAQATQVKFERYQGEFVYEVEFIAGDTEYEYKINAADGSVVKRESKTVKGPESTIPLPSGVTLEDARATALADAGVGREEAVFTEAKEDWEGGVPVFEFKFYAGNVEYEYDINAQTGAVYSKKTTTYVAQNPVGTASAAPQATPAPTARPAQTPQPTAAPAA